MGLQRQAGLKHRIGKRARMHAQLLARGLSAPPCAHASYRPTESACPACQSAGLGRLNEGSLVSKGPLAAALRLVIGSAVTVGHWPVSMPSTEASISATPAMPASSAFSSEVVAARFCEPLNDCRAFCIANTSRSGASQQNSTSASSCARDRCRGFAAASWRARPRPARAPLPASRRSGCPLRGRMQHGAVPSGFASVSALSCVSTFSRQVVG
eukprot:11876503-Alexandrium_andersonii.AAC.1